MNNIAMWVIIGAVAFFAICGIWGCCKCWGRRRHATKRRPGVPLRALRKDLRRGFESWSRNHLLSSSAILPHPNAAIVATPC